MLRNKLRIWTVSLSRKHIITSECDIVPRKTSTERPAEKLEMLEEKSKVWITCWIPMKMAQEQELQIPKGTRLSIKEKSCSSWGGKVT